MPKNSWNNSLQRYCEVKKITERYSEKVNNAESNKSPSVRKVEKTISLLDDPYRTVIKNTFIDCKNLYWWIDYYSKTTYYRIRNRAINAFLMVYNTQQ